MKFMIQTFIKTTALPMILLFSSQVMAVTVSDAISASNNENTVKAVKLWSQLASSGNMIAQYNLAKHYSAGNGVQKDKQIANKWLKNATRAGLVQAYSNLNSKAISPAKNVSLTFNVTTPISWLAEQEPQKYTIQLASSRNEKLIKNTFEENNLEGKGGYYHYVREGIDRYGLVSGTYKTVSDAKTAMKDLPQSLRKKTPWVRRIKSLQNISE